MTMHKKHHYRELLSIGFPIIIGQLGTIILGFADTLMIGHHSTPELAAAGLVNNIFGLVFVSYMGFTYGLTPIIGRLYGEERTDVIGQKVRNSFLANMLTEASSPLPSSCSISTWHISDSRRNCWSLSDLTFW